LAAEKTPITVPRRCSNQRLAIVAPSARPIAPVPIPEARPQSRMSCQAAVMRMEANEETASSANATATTRRTP